MSVPAERTHSIADQVARFERAKTEENKRFLDIENRSDSQQKLIGILGVAFEGAVS